MKRNVWALLLFFSVSWGIGYARSEKTGYPEESKITTALQKYVDQKELAGIITVVAQKDKIVSLNCVGCQNAETHKKMNPNTLFWIASQTKTFTGTAIMMLVEKGLVDLDEPITTYLPELKTLYVTESQDENKKTERKLTSAITLRHLLTHTSGMQFLGGIQQQTGHIDMISLPVSLYSTVLTPLQFNPGEKYLYSNQGINVAAAILERVTGVTYEQFLQEHILDPLDMKSTTFYPTEEQLKNFAPPHKKDANGQLVTSHISFLQYPLSDTKKRFPEAGGGLFSTPLDLVKFYQMILNGGVYNGKRILSEKSIREMGSRQTPQREGMSSYGFGWVVAPEYMGHSGACGTESRVYTKGGYILMYIAQEDGLKANKDAQSDFWKLGEELYIK